MTTYMTQTNAWNKRKCAPEPYTQNKKHVIETTGAVYCIHFFCNETTHNLTAVTQNYDTGITVTDIPSQTYYQTEIVLVDGTKILSPRLRVPETGNVSVGPESENTVTWNVGVYHVPARFYCY